MYFHKIFSYNETKCNISALYLYNYELTAFGTNFDLLYLINFFKTSSKVMGLLIICLVVINGLMMYLHSIKAERKKTY
jgi:hypothetical protein